MKLLLVNGNTTQAVTDRVVAEAERCAAPGTSITGVTARFGVSIVSTEADEAVASHAVLDALAEHYTGHDAAILAISFDTAAHAARQVVPIPVIGMTEAGLLATCHLGRRTGVITFGLSSRDMYQELLRRIGLTDRVVGMETIDLASKEAYLAAGGQDVAVLEAAEQLAAQGAGSVVVTGAVMAGVAHRLRDRAPVPLLDGIGCAVGQAEMLVRLGVKQRPAMRPLAGGAFTTGLAEALSARLSGR